MTPGEVPTRAFHFILYNFFYPLPRMPRAGSPEEALHLKMIDTFRALGTGTASLTAYAPGIAEALIATAIGLFAAIPAVIAYNRYTHDVDRLAVRYETFIEEFSNILQRQS